MLCECDDSLWKRVRLLWLKSIEDFILEPLDSDSLAMMKSLESDFVSI